MSSVLVSPGACSILWTSLILVALHRTVKCEIIDCQCYIISVTDRLFLLVEKTRMGETCLSDSSSDDDNINFKRRVEGFEGFFYFFSFFFSVIQSHRDCHRYDQLFLLLYLCTVVILLQLNQRIANRSTFSLPVMPPCKGTHLNSIFFFLVGHNVKYFLRYFV